MVKQHNIDTVYFYEADKTAVFCPCGWRDNLPGKRTLEQAHKFGDVWHLKLVEQRGEVIVR